MSLRSSDVQAGRTISAIRAEAVHTVSHTIVVSGFFQAFTMRFVSSCWAKGLPPDQKTKRMSG